jgi:hypothetical protein
MILKRGVVYGKKGLRVSGNKWLMNLKREKPL